MALSECEEFRIQILGLRISKLKFHHGEKKAERVPQPQKDVNSQVLWEEYLISLQLKNTYFKFSLIFTTKHMICVSQVEASQFYRKTVRDEQFRMMCKRLGSKEGPFGLFILFLPSLHLSCSVAVVPWK